MTTTRRRHVLKRIAVWTAAVVLLPAASLWWHYSADGEVTFRVHITTSPSPDDPLRQWINDGAVGVPPPHVMEHIRKVRESVERDLR